MSQEIKDLIKAQGDAFAEYKSAMEAKIAELKKQNGTGELDGKIAAIIADYDQMKARVDTMDADLKAGKVNSGSSQEDTQAKAHQAAFNAYCRKNDASKFANLVQVGVDADGGYACPPHLSSRVATIAAVANPIRQLATVETIDRASFQMLNDPNNMTATRIGEVATRVETSTPQIGQVEIVPREMYCYPWCTQQALDDSVWDFEAWLANKAGRAFNALEVTEFSTGNGVAGARGIADYPSVNEATTDWSWGNIGHCLTGTTSAVAVDGNDLVACMGLLDDAYQSNASWVMHPLTLVAYRNLRDAAGGGRTFLLWTPSLVPGTPDTLLGKPVYTSTGVAVQASLAYIAYYGDFREAYTIVDRIGVNIIRDNITAPGRVKFHTYRRNSGAVVNFQAMKMIRCTT